MRKNCRLRGKKQPRAAYAPKEGFVFQRKDVQPFLSSIRHEGGKRFHKG
jgi:hypothetical protein